jgi:hypothetical protein
MAHVSILTVPPERNLRINGIVNGANNDVEMVIIRESGTLPRMSSVRRGEVMPAGMAARRRRGMVSSEKKM